MAGCAGGSRGGRRWRTRCWWLESTRGPAPDSFPFTNRGGAAVGLPGARASCACFRPELPKRVLAPGESATLDLHGNTLAQSAGPQTWRVRVGYREEGVERELILEVRAV